MFDDGYFCNACQSSVTYNNGKTCKRCGVALRGEEDFCGNCTFDKLWFDRAYSVFEYDGAVRKAILDIKFNGCGTNALYLAHYLADYAQSKDISFDAVTFVPMSKQALKKRRYNQARLLAESFCDILNKYDLLTEAIVKVKDTVPQEKLTRSDRKVNLTGSFAKHPDADVRGKRVLLIDDIKTTGATVNECAKVLKKAGAIYVCALTVASRREQFSYEVR